MFVRASHSQHDLGASPSNEPTWPCPLISTSAHRLYPKEDRGKFVARASIDGTLLQLRVDGVRRRQGGGLRGPIRGFSRQSRKRLLDRLNAIPHKRLKRDQVRLVTLTYPLEWPESPDQWHDDLGELRQLIERDWGKWWTVWKLEPQERGAPHWHLLVITSRSDAENLQEFRDWLSVTWSQISGVSLQFHPGGGTHVENARHKDDACLIIARYIAKVCPDFKDAKTGDRLAVGRRWDIWNREAFPAEMVAVVLSRREFECLFRLVWSYLGWRRPCWVECRNVFVPYKDAQVLLRRAKRLAALPLPKLRWFGPRDHVRLRLILRRGEHSYSFYYLGKFSGPQREGVAALFQREVIALGGEPVPNLRGNNCRGPPDRSPDRCKAPAQLS